MVCFISMITPLKYFADHRPYFTIHDSEFKEYTMDAPTPPAVILGVTNPFFAKTLQHWPHIIRISNGGTSGKFSTGENKENTYIHIYILFMFQKLKNIE